MTIKHLSKFRLWLLTLLVGAGLTAAFFSAVIVLKHQGIVAVDIFFSGLGGPIFLLVVAAASAFALSRGITSIVGRCATAVGVFALMVLIEAMATLTVFCIFGECL